MLLVDSPIKHSRGYSPAAEIKLLESQPIVDTATSNVPQRSLGRTEKRYRVSNECYRYFKYLANALLRALGYYNIPKIAYRKRI